MKFDSYKAANSSHTIFSAIIGDMEFYEKENSNLLLERFRNYILTKLALMIAGYYFKHHKDEFITFLNSNEIKVMVAKELSNKIKLELII